MNYNTYRFQKFLEKLFYGFIDIILYIPRQLYKHNDKFHKWVNESEKKSYNKNKIKMLSKKIFHTLEEQDDCIIFIGIDDYNYFGFDYRDSRFEVLLTNEEWVIKNKLKVDKMTLFEYVEKYMPHKKYLVSSWNKDKFVYFISR